jgi:hypothetical protein
MAANGVRTSVPVQVSSSDVENVEIAIPPPVTLEGRILVEGTEPVDLSGARLTFMAGTGSYGGMAIALADGSFRFNSVSEREGSLNVQIPGVNAFVKSVRAGGRDLDAARLNLNQNPGPLEVLISLNPGKVEGTVTREESSSQQAVPVSAVSVLLIP